MRRSGPLQACRERAARRSELDRADPRSPLDPCRERAGGGREIQHYIQREGLGPDDFLGREEDLAAEFGVSRPTLREALRLLA